MILVPSPASTVSFAVPSVPPNGQGFVHYAGSASHVPSVAAPPMYFLAGLPAPMVTLQVGTPAPWMFEMAPHPTQSHAAWAPQCRPLSNSQPSTSTGKLQESDKLERLSVGCADSLAGTAAENVRLVSLGGYCGPKISFQKMGRGAETLPFDWLRTRIEGILHFLRSDFNGFFQWDSKAQNGPMTIYRSRYHSFWHDDPDDAGMRERYTRRIKRFWEIDAKTRPALFVRAAVCTDEVLSALDLLAELQNRFGPQARLLLILDGQVARRVVIRGNANLLILCGMFTREAQSNSPFIQPVREALDWVIGKPLVTEAVADIREFHKCLMVRALEANHYATEVPAV